MRSVIRSHRSQTDDVADAHGLQAVAPFDALQFVQQRRHQVGDDPNKKYHAGLRPMQLAKKGAKPVPGLFA